MLPESVRAAVTAATGQPSNALEITLRAPQFYQSNQLFDVWVEGRHLIVKQFLKEDEWSESPAREFHSLHLLAPLDIAPRPVFYDAAIGPVVIYEYMEGHMWGRYRPSADELRQLAAAWARLYMVPRAGLWPARSSDWTPATRVAWFHELLDNYSEWAEVAFPLGLKAAALCREMVKPVGVVLERLQQNMPAHSFARGDTRFANVIIRPDGRYGFVDWEDAGLHDPTMELADTMMHPEQEDLLTEAEWQPFVETYCQAVGFEQGRVIQRIEDYRTSLALFWIVVLMNRGIKRAESAMIAEWEVNDMRPHIRLQRYLAHLLVERQGKFDPAAYADVFFFPTA
jgi:aminoglycoside phosphotransferase (APT) family kinase protein